MNITINELMNKLINIFFFIDIVLFYLLYTFRWINLVCEIEISPKVDYGTMECRMDKIDSQVVPLPPKLLASFRTGFDAIANQAAIILIPITIDLILWLGPHLQVKSLIQAVLNAMLSSSELTSSQSGELLASSKEVIQTAASQFNLFSLFRTIPVGIPSIMSGRMPVSVPSGSPLFIDVTSSLVVAFIVIGIVLFGLMIGCFYYLLVVQASFQGKINIRETFTNWSRVFVQVLSLSVALLIIFVAISVPSSCVISAVTLFGLPLGQFAIFLYIGVVLWLAFPLVFSAHGIFINHHNALVSVQRSMILTRMTLPTTSLFIFIVLAVSQGLDMLWRVPPESSWLTLIGIGGHAFITSALLASSFVYYRDADRWVQDTLKNLGSIKKSPLHGN